MQPNSTKFLLVLALSEAVFCLLFWVFSPAAAYILSLSVSSVSAAILLISLIADAIEASRISRSYYYAMFITVTVPLLVYKLVSFL
jgi:hypothetical protein